MVTQFIAEYVSDVKYADLPESVRHEGVRAFLNWLGCALGGHRHGSVDVAARALAPFSGPPQATVLGRGARYDILLASCLNCLSSSVNTYDDTHAEAMVHPTGPVAAAILAIAEWQKISGPDFIVALCLGIEMECRLSKAVSVAPACGSIAWSQTGIAGGFGAAIAVGKLLGLNKKQLTWAMGTALSQAAGFRAMHGSMNLHMMHARTAPSGIQSALLARGGFTSSEAAIDGKFGFASVFSERPNLGALTKDLGSIFELSANTYKPYPCGIVIHPIIDACLQLRSKLTQMADPIVQVQIKAYREVLTLTYRKQPKDALEAQVSVYYWAAVALLKGRAGLAELGAEFLTDASIAALQERIQVETDASMAIDQAEVTVTAASGQIFDMRVQHCEGSLESPMTDEQLEGKFRMQSLAAVGPAALDRLVNDCWRLEELSDVTHVIRGLD